MTIAIAALLGVIAGICAPYILNRKKNRHQAEDLEVLGRMQFIDGFTAGWDRAFETIDQTVAQCESISETKKD
ncbi:hypothetical protein SEA_MAYA_32 [Streptomyces phage Maya]|nr:hypothetical protein SEA_OLYMPICHELADO_32 [Streptomyces phage OlympicHelado]ASU04027.1 hypothetical protein SEA_SPECTROPATRONM_32 [Streptomyces phage Spectropatronm]QAY16244.1 hypothetical protein SEA_ICEWARRIOR_32 [Streptomyces phage IceWarrior]QAY16330.1 hypothetical protein SEA_NAMO_32 [Streptomyces phage Namo]QDM56533.1 hypothetical protein SEA_ESKETIT_32 [Streptomyces phage Esketit]QEQ93725.1 hypothetical protein SEA_JAYLOCIRAPTOR_32 [Streptomyces phage Jaylociraptor]QEQ93811.1 hypoth